jgi:DNA-binding transcriptional ArsR family regulator
VAESAARALPRADGRRSCRRRGLRIAEKLGVSQPTLSEHMRILVQAELVIPKRIKQWTFYRRNEARISVLKARIAADV